MFAKSIQPLPRCYNVQYMEIFVAVKRVNLHPSLMHAHDKYTVFSRVFRPVWFGYQACKSDTGWLTRRVAVLYTGSMPLL